MEFRIQQQQEEGSSSGYNNSCPPSLPTRLSAFPKPTLSPSSSLIFSPRAPGVAVARGTPPPQQQPSRNGNSPFFEMPTTATAKSIVSDHHLLTNSSRNLSSPTTTLARMPPAATAETVKYKECMKNHAASSGRHVVDGCGEFMTGGEEGTPEALKCAACSCHRSFHRRKSSNSGGQQQQQQQQQDYILTKNGALQQTPSSSHSPVIISPQSRHLKKQQLSQNVPPAFPSGFPPSPIAFDRNNNNINTNNIHDGIGGTPTESSSEELNNVSGNGIELGTSSQRNSNVPGVADGTKKKRFRTKFTTEQKQKMLQFADRVGWRVLRQDEAAVERFCTETGVRRQVLKVWMHNNKHTLRKQNPSEHQLQD